jgi:hypothetical protein
LQEIHFLRTTELKKRIENNDARENEERAGQTAANTGMQAPGAKPPSDPNACDTGGGAFVSTRKASGTPAKQ